MHMELLILLFLAHLRRSAERHQDNRQSVLKVRTSHFYHHKRHKTIEGGQESLETWYHSQKLLPILAPGSAGQTPPSVALRSVHLYVSGDRTVLTILQDATGQRTSQKRAGISSKYRPQILVKGENLPLEILRCLSEWFSVLEDRGVVPGTSMGQMLGLVAAFEDNLTALERILTTPLPL